jgi:ATP-dependent helicase/nuclease subunit A
VTVDSLNRFDQDARYWGLAEAYRKYIHHLGITNENADLNLKVIDTINELFHQDQESVMTQLARGDNERISLDLRWGKNSHMVQIMTAHASKGLEFDTVYLAGIYTNGRENNDTSLFGDRPGSFKWYLDLAQRDKRESPFYIYESELSRYKSFSESKRLFYVACTRAKKRLIWVNLELPEKCFSIPANSWVDGLNYWLQQQSDNLAVIDRQKEFDYRALLAQESRPQLPMFFHDPVGIFPKEGMDSELALTAELSVTRLNSLVDCPRKFYFQNVLKLKEQKSQTVFREELDQEEFYIQPSSAERGTYIHAQIAEGIEHNFVVPRESFSGTQREPIQWALDQLKELSVNYQLIAEKALKFRFFNFMVSGIPDLLLIPKTNQNAQVWDFKTGKMNKENLAHYWVQLKAYAYGLYQLQRVDFSSEIELKLIFVDHQQVLTEVVNFQRCQQDLYPLWQSQNQPWKINSEHCTQCSYGDICPR